MQSDPDQDAPDPQPADADEAFDEDAEPVDADALEADDADDESDAADPAAEVEHLRAERDALYEKLARTQADYQNATRRVEKDSEQRLALAIGAFIRELLPVLDNLERAQQVPGDSPASAVLDGVRSTQDEFLKVLAKHGVERLAPEKGEPFDPQHHEALMQQPSDEYDSPTVLQTYQPGYQLNGRVVRPAQVVVSQGS